MSVHRRPVFVRCYVLKPPMGDLPHTIGSHEALVTPNKVLMFVGWVTFLVNSSVFPDEIAFCQ
jgi:hypothetical protein